MARTPEGFLRSLDSDRPPGNSGAAATALWWDLKGEWDKAHACVDASSDEAGIRVHAYLHRKEGDLGNAAYWYGRVGLPTPDGALAEERETLINELLKSEER